MNETHNIQKDKFEIFLDEILVKLQNCQKEKAHKSCSACKHYFNCELRKEYVQAVYNSMSKGATGGFEF